MSRPKHLTHSSPVPFALSIADITVAVFCNEPALATKLRHRYRAFPAQGSPQLTVQVHLTGGLRPSALLDTGIRFRNGVLHFTAPGYEGFIDEKAGKGELHLSSAHPIEEVDYFLRTAYALLALHVGGLLLHAAGIVHRKRAYLFFGPSGCGKTTVAQLSCDDLVLNDDLVLLLPEEGRWMAYATPFWNPSQVRPAGVMAAPVAGMFHLVQDVEVYLQEMGKAQALAELMANIPIVTGDPSRAHRLLDVCRRLLDVIPVSRLHFLPDASFWRLVNQGGERET